MIHVVIVIVVAADHDQELRAIYAAEQKRLQLQLEDYRTGAHQICCSKCAWTEWYTTPGKAKMGLAGHQRRHRR